jgi:replicative DNA helicase
MNKIIQNEILKSKKQVLEYKETVESHIIGALYKDKEKIYQSDIDLDDFNNNIWKVYFAIINNIIKKENKQVIDDININTFLEKHSKLKIKYEEYGGYQTIVDLKELIEHENFDSHIEELHKWSTVLTLLDRGFIVDLKECIDMKIGEIYDLLETLLNDSFVKNTSDEIVGSFDIADNLNELIDELNEGTNIGLPYEHFKILNDETGGMIIGNLTLIGGLSGQLKSTFIRSNVLPAIIKNNEKILIMLNEEDERKWKAEMLLWIANNVLKKEIIKYRIRDGKFSKEEYQILKESAEWLKEKKNQIIIIPFKKWRTATAIKLIRKYRAMGVKYAVVDTLKLDAGQVNNNSWLALAQNVVDLYDSVKKNEKNLGMNLICTFQLAKGESYRKHYAQDSIGIAKNMVDVAGQCLMVRTVWQEEKEGGKYEIKAYRLEGKTKIPITLQEDKVYQILFIVKNRFGQTDPYQIVMEVDASRNYYKEIGITWIESDY